MAALRLLNRKCGRIRAVKAVNRASDTAGDNARKRLASTYIMKSNPVPYSTKCLTNSPRVPKNM